MVLHVVNDAHFFPRLIDYGEKKLNYASFV